MPAIPTHYDGRRFRSRVEARWAISLDHYGYDWTYEPRVETSVPYQPDFWLPAFNVYIEVKAGSILPIHGEDHEALVADLVRFDADDRRWRSFVHTTATDLWVLVGEPVRWIEGIPARPAWGLMYSYRSGNRHLIVWSEQNAVPGPWGTLRRWEIGPVMTDAACSVRDFDFDYAAA